MPAHTKMHPIDPKKKNNKLGPATYKNESTPWREVAKERIEEYSEVGIMIRGSRLKEGMTQKQLAELLEVKPHHISEMEHGKRSVGKGMAQRLGKVFNVDYRVFL